MWRWDRWRQWRLSARLLLLEHLGSGKDWDLARREGGITFVSPFQSSHASDNKMFSTHMEALKSMKEYIDGYRTAVNKLEKEDEGAAKIAISLLENTTVNVNDVHKHEDKRVVTYTLETDGLSKTRKATLRKEEGAWRVEAITEAD